MEKAKSFENQKTQFHLFQDDNNLWCCGGKIRNADVPYQVKHPYILDKNHYFTKLIIAYHQKLLKHCGVWETLDPTCAEYWIPHGGSVICKFIFNCSICRKNDAKPYSYPQNSNLPKERLSEGHTFLNVGIDYARPMYLKNIYNNDSNDMYKAWLVIITCELNRGIYLDLVPDGTGESCIKVLRWFIGNRGSLQVIISDNGKFIISEHARTL